MASIRLIAANRRNAAKSTGPTSDEGKSRSRANAFKHGLAAETLVADGGEAEAVRERVEEWRESVRPATAEDAWLLEQAVVSSLRVDRCRREEAAVRAYQAERARVCWDEDRRAEAEEVALKLAKTPAAVVARLKKTKQGCEWLIDRWTALAAVLADQDGVWTEEQAAVARNLLAQPPEARSKPFETTPAETAADAIAGLEGLAYDALGGVDERERVAAEAGVELKAGRQVALLKRYEAACFRRYEWARARIRQSAPAEPQAPPEPAEQRVESVPVETEPAVETAAPAARAPEPVAVAAGIWADYNPEESLLFNVLRAACDHNEKPKPKTASERPQAGGSDEPAGPGRAPAPPGRGNRRSRKAAARRAARGG